MKIISRKDAKSLGLTYYFTGKPCKNGHASMRRTVKADCLECIRESDRERYASNPGKFKKRQANIYQSRKCQIKSRMSFYASKNKQKISKYKSEWVKKRCASDPVFAITKRVRELTRLAFKKNGYQKNTKTAEILGCDWDTLKHHIERQFIKGMGWDNRDQWHIDHIVPLASANTEEDVIALNHYTNLRPMWASENISKGAKMEFLI